jgi:hypothetical protein
MLASPRAAVADGVPLFEESEDYVYVLSVDRQSGLLAFAPPEN